MEILISKIGCLKYFTSIWKTLYETNLILSWKLQKIKEVITKNVVQVR